MTALAGRFLTPSSARNVFNDFGDQFLAELENALRPDPSGTESQLDIFNPFNFEVGDVRLKDVVVQQGGEDFLDDEGNQVIEDVLFTQDDANKRDAKINNLLAGFTSDRFLSLSRKSRNSRKRVRAPQSRQVLRSSPFVSGGGIQGAF